MSSANAIRIDFVSDVACPWCMIGLAGLQQALCTLTDVVDADIHLQPFELSPELPIEGGDADAHLMEKYSIDAQQLDANRATIRERAAALGVAYNVHHGSRIWNTFDAHRLLHWAGAEHHEHALPLKQALFRAYFGDGDNVADHAVLVRLAMDAGLDAQAARRVLDAGDYAEEVRAQERWYQDAGVHSVPATIVDRKHLIPGGQPPAVFERALRQIATGVADT